MRPTDDIRREPGPAVHLPTYADQRLEPVPNAGAAHRTDRGSVIGAVLQAILTERNITTTLAAANGLQPGDDAPGYRFTREEIQQLKGHPELFVQAVGGAAAARDFLFRVITEIRVHPGKSVIHYAIPLPAESPLAGMRQQEIRIPEEALA